MENVISHIKKTELGEFVCQTNDEHSLGVATLAKRFADEFGLGDFGYIMGKLHDIGKEKQEFQNYIRDVNGISGYKNWTVEGKRHAYVGGLIARKIYGNCFSLIGNPIMGHHRGLYDYVDMELEMRKEIPEEVNVPNGPYDVMLPKWFNPNTLKHSDFHHLVRMLYSCLVDADYLDTESFMQPNQAKFREGKSSLEDLLPKLELYLSNFANPKTEINKIRCEIQNVCKEKSERKPGFYSLTVPTGGGKTLSSIVWAMNHAIKYGKKRIIIAIPYTSIIVQTSNILRSIFGEENVLEHHSNIDLEDKIKDELTTKLKLATENWDYPIIVTTNVQLFESMMSSRSSNCRKLHNICNSVLILDEVQTLPTDFLQTIVDSLDTYQRIFGTSVLFTTASQPILEGKHQGVNPGIVLNGLERIEEIIPSEFNLYKRLRRVELDIDDTPRTYDEIAEKLKQHNRVLCIVNTRRDAKELYDRLPKEGIYIHLSRMMCPAHLKEKLQEMKEAISDDKNKIVRVISTQLIEAGVDIDFPVVYRQEAGLDSVLQAAGRCNREGKLPLSTTHVFSLAAEHQLPRGFITQCNNARKNMKQDLDWFSQEAMSNYFEQLYSRIESFDNKGIKQYLKMQELMFETVGQKFHLIDDTSIPVIVNWKKSMLLVEKLKHDGPSYTLMKQLSQFVVNLRKYDFETMLKEHIIEEPFDGVFIIANKAQYDKDVGLLTDNQWIEELLIV